MLQCGHQIGEIGQALDREPVRLSSRRPVRPGDRQRHPPSRAAFTDEHPLGSGAALLEDDRQALATERVERVGDDDRLRKRARLGRTGAMRAPSEPYLLVGVGILALVCSQSAYQSGPIAYSMPMHDLLEPSVAAIIGITALNERIPLDPRSLAIIGIGALMACTGIVILSRSPVVHGEYLEHEREGSDVVSVRSS